MKDLLVPEAYIQAYRLKTVRPGNGMGDVPAGRIIADVQGSGSVGWGIFDSSVIVRY